MTAKALREQILASPPAERALLMQDLWDSFEADDAALPVQAEHVDRIVASTRLQPRRESAAVIPWPKGREQVRRAIADAKKAK